MKGRLAAPSVQKRLVERNVWRRMWQVTTVKNSSPVILTREPLMRLLKLARNHHIKRFNKAMCEDMWGIFCKIVRKLDTGSEVEAVTWQQFTKVAEGNYVCELLYLMDCIKVPNNFWFWLCKCLLSFIWWIFATSQSIRSYPLKIDMVYIHRSFISYHILRILTCKPRKCGDRPVPS